MIRYFLLITTLLAGGSLLAQDAFNVKGASDKPNTLLSEGGRPTGGFFAPSAKIAQLDGQTTVFAGAKMAMVLGHQFNIGMAGFGMLSKPDTYTLPMMNGGVGEYKLTNMGYFGVYMEPVFFNKSVVHLTVPAIVGIGVGQSEHHWYNNGYYWSGSTITDAFMVLEPGLNVEVNIAGALRFFGGGSYRFVLDSNLMPDSDERLSGFSINFGLKIGWF